MWRDIERKARTGMIYLNQKLLMPYPLQAFDQANKVGIVLNQQGKYLEYFEETYRIWFVSGIRGWLGGKSEASLQKHAVGL